MRMVTRVKREDKILLINENGFGVDKQNNLNSTRLFYLFQQVFSQLCDYYRNSKQSSVDCVLSKNWEKSNLADCKLNSRLFQSMRGKFEKELTKHAKN